MKKTKKNKKKLKTFIMIDILLIIIVIGLLVLFNLPKDEIIKGSNENTEKLNKNQLAVKINATLNFDNYISNNAGIENPSNNNYDVIVKIYLNGSKDEIYTSQKMSPGDKINKIRLNKNLKKGQYKAIAYFNAYDKDNNYKGKSGVEINLNVE